MLLHELHGGCSVAHDRLEDACLESVSQVVWVLKLELRVLLQPFTQVEDLGARVKLGSLDLLVRVELWLAAICTLLFLVGGAREERLERAKHRVLGLAQLGLLKLLPQVQLGIVLVRHLRVNELHYLRKLQVDQLLHLRCFALQALVEHHDELGKVVPKLCGQFARNYVSVDVLAILGEHGLERAENGVRGLEELLRVLLVHPS